MKTTAPIDLRACEGKVIADHYRLDAFLAEGCFGGVFRASQLAYGSVLRTVALKVAKRPMMDSEARYAFRDALLMARVADGATDPAIRNCFVTVHDAGCCPPDGPLAGHPFMAMEFVPGDTLAGRLEGGPFPLTRAIRCFDQLLRAVAFMHQPIERADGRCGPVIHRDLKPSNILMHYGRDGREVIKLTDFGCAFELDTLLTWTHSEGDLAYLAPESFAQEVNSPQSDLYMLGLILYEMLAGQNPFRTVGAHLRGNTEANRAELRRIHLAARQLESFTALDSLTELRARPAIARFIRQSLTVDMASRPWPDAISMHAAWVKTLQDGDPVKVTVDENPWDTVRRLTAEADQCFQVGEDQRGEHLLEQAQQINRDAARVPNHLLVGTTYLHHVRCLLKKGLKLDAGRLAKEAYQRRRCRSTCEAMALYCATANPDMARQFRQEATSHPDDR